MGWWERDGLTWGDEPADIIDDALELAIEKFVRYWGREPTMAELRAGLEFSLRTWDGISDRA